MYFQILDSDDPEECLPLFLRPTDPMCAPVLSVNTPTTNVVVQITVPKQTGRKRKRGSNDPFTYPNGSTELDSDQTYVESDIRRLNVRNDDPAVLRRMMQDNVGRYSYEVVAKIRHTHRFRGMWHLLRVVVSGLMCCAQVFLTFNNRRSMVNLCPR